MSPNCVYRLEQVRYSLFQVYQRATDLGSGRDVVSDVLRRSPGHCPVRIPVHLALRTRWPEGLLDW